MEVTDDSDRSNTPSDPDSTYQELNAEGRTPSI